MKLLFKLNAALPNGTKELVGHYNFREHYPAINVSMAWNTISPYIRIATNTYVIPFLGKTLYNSLATDYEGTIAEDWKLSIIEHLQDAISHYAIYEAMPVLNVTVADMGVTQNAATEGTSTPASQWSFKNARWEAIKKADAAMDLALAEIESSNQSYFNAYKTSAEYKNKSSLFFRSTNELNQYLNIQQSRRAFISISKYLTKATELYLIPILGQTYYDALKASIEANTISNIDAALLPYIKRLLAEYGLYEAIPHIAIVADGDGFKVVSSTDMYEDRKNVANFREAINALSYKAEENGRTARANLIEFLYANEDDYPTWKESSFYEAPADRELPISTSSNQIGGIFI